MSWWQAALVVALLTPCVCGSEAPSNLVVVGGFPTCGISYIYGILESHPNIVTFSIQIGALPNLQTEFEESVFALAKALQVPTGRPLQEVCRAEFKSQAPTFRECNRLVNTIRGWYNMSVPATLVVSDESFFEKQVGSILKNRNIRFQGAISQTPSNNPNPTAPTPHLLTPKP